MHFFNYLVFMILNNFCKVKKNLSIFYDLKEQNYHFAQLYVEDINLPLLHKFVNLSASILSIF